MPNPDAVALSAAIARALCAARGEVGTPLAITMDPPRRASVGTWWAGGGKHRLFGLPVESVMVAAGMDRVR